jgi:hypothetical protein
MAILRSRDPDIAAFIITTTFAKVTLAEEGEADHGAQRARRVSHGDGERCLRIDGFGPGPHVACLVRLEVARGDDFVPLPGQAGHALSLRDELGGADDRRWDVHRRRDLEDIALEHVNGTGNGPVGRQKFLEPSFYSHRRTLS